MPMVIQKQLFDFNPRTFGNQINSDLSSRIQFEISEGSFDSLSSQTTVTPTLINDGSFTYFSEIFSTNLTGDSSLVISDLIVRFDNTQIPNKTLQVRFEKVNPQLTDITFIPDINKFNQDGLPQSSRPIFADGNAPATFRILPKFSDGSTIITSYLFHGLSPELVLNRWKTLLQLSRCNR